MRNDASVEKAERASSLRASLMAAGAVILAINAGLQWSNGESVRPGFASWLWVLLVLLWTAVLATGGGLALGRRMRALINDELSLRNRARAIAAGFYAMLATALGLYVSAWYVEIAGGDSVRRPWPQVCRRRFSSTPGWSGSASSSRRKPGSRADPPRLFALRSRLSPG